jgi:hypothetical protein
MPELKLSWLAIFLGAALALPQIYGILKPAAFGQSLRAFPRSLPWGYFLMILGTVWFLLNLSQESIADFAAYKVHLLALFAAVGIGSCIFVKDFLAVRGLAVVLLLLAKLMVDTGRPALRHTCWVEVIQVWAYFLVVCGMWFTVSPWRLREIINWHTQTENRVRIGCWLRLAFGVLVLVLGLTRFARLP